MSKYCPYCGAAVEEGFIFCERCGKRIPVQTNPEVNSDQPTPEEKPEKEKKPKKEHSVRNKELGKKLALAVVIVIVAVVLGFSVHDVSFQPHGHELWTAMISNLVVVTIVFLGALFLFKEQNQWLHFAKGIALNFLMFFAMHLSYGYWMDSITELWPLTIGFTMLGTVLDCYGKKTIGGIVWCLTGAMALLAFLQDGSFPPVFAVYFAVGLFNILKIKLWKKAAK